MAGFADVSSVRLRRSSGGRVVDRRTADIVRGVLLYSISAVVAGAFGWLIVLLSAAA
jgi:hypothetical protein